MKVKDIYSCAGTNIFVVTDQSDDDELNWDIEPTDLELLPEEENFYFVKAYEVSSDSITECYLGIMTPERIAESVIRQTGNGQSRSESIYDQKRTIIPAVASNCFGDYTLYYSKENPQTGIDILRSGLDKAINKNVVAEDLGYILRDEGRLAEAIEAFKISEAAGPSSEYIYLELSELYKQSGQIEESLQYEQKFKEQEEDN